METRDGLIEFQLKEVEYIHKGKIRVKDVLQYRQVFKGIWQDWKDVKLPKGD